MLLNENLFDDLEFIEEPIPAVEEEPIPAEEMTPETPAQGVDTGIANLIHDLIIDEHEAIQGYNNMIANLEAHPELIPIMQDIANEEMNHIGMLEVALELLSPNAESMETGEVEAEELLDTIESDNLSKEELSVSNEIDTDNSVEESLENGKVDTHDAKVLDAMIVYLRDQLGDNEFKQIAIDKFGMTAEDLTKFCDLSLEESLTEAQAYNLPNYVIVTDKCVYDFSGEDSLDPLIMEQDEKLKSLGYDMDTEVTAHFFNSAFYDEFTKEEVSLNDAIQILAIKDGVDLVKFASGNYGFVAYYNNHENGFEIIDSNKKVEDLDESLHITKNDLSIMKNIRDSIIASGLVSGKKEIQLLADIVWERLCEIGKVDPKDELEDQIKEIDRQIKGK